MSTDKFQQSKESGIHSRLALLAGEWEGTTKTWFEADQLGDESPMQGTIRTVLDGRFLIHEYAGSLSGKSFNGMAIIGYDLSNEKFECAWVDSFHMGAGILFSEGSKTDKLFSVLGSYGAPGMTERWGWRTEIEMIDNNNIIITAYNISPQGEEAKATETLYTRKQ